MTMFSVIAGVIYTVEFEEMDVILANVEQDGLLQHLMILLGPQAKGDAFAGDRIAFAPRQSGRRSVWKSRRIVPGRLRAPTRRKPEPEFHIQIRNSFDNFSRAVGITAWTEARQVGCRVHPAGIESEIIEAHSFLLPSFEQIQHVEGFFIIECRTAAPKIVYAQGCVDREGFPGPKALLLNVGDEVCCGFVRLGNAHQGHMAAETRAGRQVPAGIMRQLNAAFLALVDSRRMLD